MKLRFILFVLFMLPGISAYSFADSFDQVDHCYKPKKPLLFSTGYHKKRYAYDIEEYQRCVKTFIDQQERAARMHKEAAENAMKMWKEFVKNNEKYFEN